MGKITPINLWQITFVIQIFISLVNGLTHQHMKSLVHAVLATAIAVFILGLRRDEHLR
jgi:hypothetical protein